MPREIYAVVYIRLSSSQKRLVWLATSKRNEAFRTSNRRHIQLSAQNLHKLWCTASVSISASSKTQEIFIDNNNERQKQEPKAFAEGKESQHRSHSDHSSVEESPEKRESYGASLQFQVQALIEARHDGRTQRPSTPKWVLLGPQGFLFKILFHFIAFNPCFHEFI